MAELKFLRGLEANLPSVATDGAFYLTSDTHRLFIGQGEALVPVNEGVITVANIAALPESAIPGSFYYATEENVLCVYNGAKWVQLNPDTGAVNFVKSGDGNVVVGMTYDEATRTVSYTMGTVDLDAVKNDVYQVTSDSLDIDTLTADITPKAGDVLVVTSTTNNIKSAYSYDAEDGWVACDGNVAADKVIIKDDITLAGDYTQVGNLTKTKTGTATFETAGKSVSAALTEIFSKRLQPKITANPSVSFTTDIKAEYEVGASVTPTYAAKLNAGSYTYGPATGITAKSWEVTDSKGNTLATASGSMPSFVVADGENYTITATASYDAGAVAVDNLKDPSDPEVKIAAGSKSATSGAITGYRQMFFGSSTTVDADLSSADIRALSTKAKAAAGDIEVPIVEGAKHVILAVPAAYTVTDVADEGAFGTPIVESFGEPKTVQVDGASADTATAYKVYEFKPDAALGANTYTVTIA